MNSGKNTMKSIAIILCYLGKLPWYFDFFVHSCKYNPTIDFFVITDDELYSKLVPENVKLIYKSLTEINKLATQKLGFVTNVQTGYKLCDFKPAYGILFSELIEGYDFWGQGDIDVIYGDIRSFIDYELLDAFDFISVRHDYTAGCLTFHKNVPLINNIFKRGRDYEKIFMSSKHYCFDECNWAYEFLSEGKSILEITTEIESFTHIIKLAEKNSEIKAHFDLLLIDGRPGKIKFDHGRIYYKNTYEAILYHLIWLKHAYTPEALPSIIPETFYVSPNRIYYR